MLDGAGALTERRSSTLVSAGREGGGCAAIARAGHGSGRRERATARACALKVSAMSPALASSAPIAAELRRPATRACARAHTHPRADAKRR